jgi:hypothetical protein
VAPLLAALSLPTALVGLACRRWLPAAQQDPRDHDIWSADTPSTPD